jgi:hypothetical protein
MTDVTPVTANYQGQTVIEATSNISTIQMLAGGNGLLQTVQSLAAVAGGGQSNPPNINSMAALITTVTTGGTSSVTMPLALPGMEISIINTTATAGGLQVFPALGQTINGGSANAAVNVPVTSVLIFFCVAAGAWWTK